MEKPGVIVRFFSFLLKVVVVLILMAAIAVASFEGVTYYLTGSLYDLRELRGDDVDIHDNGEDTIQEPEIDETNMKSFLFFVDDADSGQEYISLNMLNTSSRVMDILLIPSNAQMTVGQDLMSEIQREMPEAKNMVTLSDVCRAFGDDKYAMISDIMEDVTGLTLSGYDVMSQEDFEEFLDMVPSVAYQVDDSISYRDHNGVLDVIEGGQTKLDSDEAMALMAYMDGTEKEESDRLERTSLYLQSFFNTLLSENRSASVYKKYTNLVQSGEDRDRSGEEEILSALDAEDITIRIMQGSESNGVFSVDSQKVQLQIAALSQQAEGSVSAEKDDDTDASGSENSGTYSGEDSKDCSIELYNAAYVSGLAGEWEAYLEEEGYSISLIDSYQDEGPLSTTRIVVSEEGMGEDLLTYFPGADIEEGEIDTGGDIQVFIGTDCTDVGGGDTVYDNEDEEESYDDDMTETSDDEDSSDETETSDEEEGGSYRYNGSGTYNFDTDSE